MAEKVCNIIGMGIGAIDAPWGNTNEKFYGINNSYIYGKIDRIYCMHVPEQTLLSSLIPGRDKLSFRDAFKDNPAMEMVSIAPYIFTYSSTSQQYGYTDDVKNLEGHDMDIIVKAQQYPLIDAQMLAGCTDFTSSAPYIIAHCILEGFDRIRLYGFECWSNISNHEYEFEVPCIERWMCRARGRGIKGDTNFQMIPTLRDKQSLYGYEIGDEKA